MNVSSGALPANRMLGANNYRANLNAKLAACVHGAIHAGIRPIRQARRICRVAMTFTECRIRLAFANEGHVNALPLPPPPRPRLSGNGRIVLVAIGYFHATDLS